jgi:hypothetical protein
MKEQNKNKREMARIRADRELERLTDKYLGGVILDDGDSDALSYAVTQLGHAIEEDMKVDIDRWTYAISLATSMKTNDFSQLKRDIEFDARGFIETADTTDWEDYGHALFNLADSIVPL